MNLNVKSVAELERQDEEDNGLVIFTRKHFSDLADHFHCQEQELIEKYQGVHLYNLEKNDFTIEKIPAVVADGSTKTIVTIGLGLGNGEEFIRFLNEDEPVFGIFLQNHVLFNFIDWADDPVKSQEIFNQIEKEYKQNNLAS